MNVGDQILTVLAYIAAGLFILSVPAIAIAYLVKGPLDQILKSINDSHYRRVDNAMRATERIHLDDGTIILKQYVNGRIDYKPIHKPRVVEQGVKQTDAGESANTDAINAARWIVASYATGKCSNEAHDHGASGKQLLTQDECLAMGVMGSPREWDAARRWMKAQWLIAEHSGTTNPGTFTSKPLSEMIKLLTALPQRK